VTTLFEQWERIGRERGWIGEPRRECRFGLPGYDFEVFVKEWLIGHRGEPLPHDWAWKLLGHVEIRLREAKKECQK